VTLFAYIPSPSFKEIDLGPLTITMYALFMVLAIFVGCLITMKRYREKGGFSDSLIDIFIWAIVFGIIGARLYHVFTTPNLYFKDPNSFIDILKIWKGGLGIWGAIGGGMLGAWIGARREGVLLAPIADSVAPALPIAQAIGRLGNWFNQELFGAPTNAPWGLSITDKASLADVGYPLGTHFHPTFLYEIIWDLLLALVLFLLDRKFRLGFGQLFSLYVFGYCLGRFWIEQLRIDYSLHILGLRFNDWVSLILCLGAAAVFVRLRIKHRKHKILPILDDEELTNEYHFVITDDMEYPVSPASTQHQVEPRKKTAPKPATAENPAKRTVVNPATPAAAPQTKLQPSAVKDSPNQAAPSVSRPAPIQASSKPAGQTPSAPSKAQPATPQAPMTRKRPPVPPQAESPAKPSDQGTEVMTRRRYRLQQQTASKPQQTEPNQTEPPQTPAKNQPASQPKLQAPASQSETKKPEEVVIRRRDLRKRKQGILK
jgi:prolipoprotein diacylglyceryl transferase